jgi:hypothetical protein
MLLKLSAFSTGPGAMIPFAFLILACLSVATVSGHAAPVDPLAVDGGFDQSLIDVPGAPAEAVALSSDPDAPKGIRFIEENVLKIDPWIGVSHTDQWTSPKPSGTLFGH